MKVKIMTMVVTDITRAALLPGTTGRVLDICRNGKESKLIVDFGLISVIVVPENSHLIEVIRDAPGIEQPGKEGIFRT